MNAYYISGRSHEGKTSNGKQRHEAVLHHPDGKTMLTTNGITVENAVALLLKKHFGPDAKATPLTTEQAANIKTREPSNARSARQYFAIQLPRLKPHLGWDPVACCFYSQYNRSLSPREASVLLRHQLATATSDASQKLNRITINTTAIK